MMAISTFGASVCDELSACRREEMKRIMCSREPGQPSQTFFSVSDRRFGDVMSCDDIGSDQ